MTMTEVRDWQKDMELGHTARYENAPIYLNPVLDAYFYWMSEAATEKERADKAEQRARVTDAMEATARAAGAALIETEAREKKLREAIEQAIKEYGEWNDKSAAANVMVEILMHAIEPSYYPVDKEEAKTFTFDAIIHIYDGIKTTVQKQRLTVEGESAEEAEKKLSKKIHDGYKALRHLGLSSLLLTQVKEEEAK